jgi:hypothetical protein
VLTVTPVTACRSFDDQAPQIIDALAQNTLPDWATGQRQCTAKRIALRSRDGIPYAEVVDG